MLLFHWTPFFPHTVRFSTRFAQLNPCDVGNVIYLELAVRGQVASAFEV